MYIGNQPVLQTSEFREEFTATAGQTVFNTLGFAYSTDSAFVEIFRNGVLLGTEDYTLGTDGTTVTLSDACSLNDIVLIKGRRAITQGISITESRTEYTWQSGDTYVQLNADIVPGYADVYLNGVKLPSAEFSIDTGNKRVTFTTTPSIGDEVSVVYRTETSSLVALPLKDGAGNTILSESGGTVTLENASLGDTVLMPDNSNNVSTAPGIRFEADTDTGIGLASSGNLAIVTGGTERMRIDSSGNLLVGTLAQITNGFLSLKYFGGTKNGIVFDDTYTTGITYSCYFKKNGTAVGGITHTISSTSYNTSSDYRLKTDVQPMVNATDRLKALKPVNFEWISSGERVDGFLAHEAQEVVPEAVTGEKDAVDADGNPEYQGIDQAKLVPLLTAALQETLALVEAQSAKIDALETRIQALEVINGE